MQIVHPVRFIDCVFWKLIREWVKFRTINCVIQGIRIWLKFDMQSVCLTGCASVDHIVRRGIGNFNHISVNYLVKLYSDDLFAKEIFNELDQFTQASIACNCDYVRRWLGNLEQLVIIVVSTDTNCDHSDTFWSGVIWSIEHIIIGVAICQYYHNLIQPLIKIRCHNFINSLVNGTTRVRTKRSVIFRIDSSQKLIFGMSKI